MIYRCRACGYIFNEELEDKEFSELTECPNCKQDPIAFQAGGGTPYHKSIDGKPKLRIGIYHYQYYRGACKLCYRHFIQEMVESYDKCYDAAMKIYGQNVTFEHFTDFGQFDSNTLDRPSFIRFKEAIENGDLDVVMCYRLNNITTNEDLLIDFYQYVRSKNIDFITECHGKDAMKYIDLFIEKNKKA